MYVYAATTPLVCSDGGGICILSPLLSREVYRPLLVRQKTVAFLSQGVTPHRHTESSLCFLENVFKTLSFAFVPSVLSVVISL